MAQQAVWVLFAFTGSLVVVIWVFIIAGSLCDRSRRREREEERRARELAALGDRIDRLAGRLERTEGRLSVRIEHVDRRLTTHVAAHASMWRSPSSASR